MALSGVKEADAADLELHDMIPGGVVVPEEFTCPISKKLMKDPVIVPSTGVTYDRHSIEKWIEDGNATCPQTGRRIQSLAMLIQNNVLKDMISSWCENPPLNNEFQEADFQSTMEINLKAETLEDQIKLFEDQRELFERLRRLTKENRAFRKHFVESAGVHVPMLFNGLCLAIAASRNGIFLDDLRDSLIATITNIAIHSDDVKMLVANKPHRIGIIAEAMDVRGDIRIRTTAASAIKTLSTFDLFKEQVLEDYKSLSGSLIGVMQYLKGMLEVCDALAVEEAVGAILSLCSVPGNMKRALECGMVGSIMNNIKRKVFVGDMLRLLAMFSTDKTVIEEIVVRFEAISCLFKIIKSDSSPYNRENCVTILHEIVAHTLSPSPSKSFKKRLIMVMKQMINLEDTHGLLASLVMEGTPIAKTKARGILAKILPRSMRERKPLKGD